MFLDSNKAILYNTAPEQGAVDLYFIHDLHFGSAEFDKHKYEALKKEILLNDNALVCFVGDLMENAIPHGKSDVFTQTHSPVEQREWVVQQFVDFGKKILAVVPGNHEHNRSTKIAGLYPLYDACLIAGISDKYRDTYAIIDLGIGTRASDRKKQVHYVGQIQHMAKDIKACCSADYTDGIDFFVFGHDHEAKDKPRAKLVYDSKNKTIYKRNVEVINCGSFLKYGGYGARSAYRPQSDKMYMLRLYGDKHKMETRGFYI